MSNLRAIAKREIAREKGAYSRKHGPELTEFERTAEKWDTQQNIKTKKAHDEEQTGPEIGTFQALTQADLERRVQSVAGDESDWRQYKPGTEEGIPEKKPVSLNPATIRAIAKKLIAREWRRARGKPQRDTRGEQLEQEAGSWHEKREQERKQKEEQQWKLMQYASNLNQLLNEFSLDLIDGDEEINLADAEDAFGEMLENVGELYKTDWSENGCRIWFEPWAEIRGRRVSASPHPVIFTAMIDNDLNITSFSENEDQNLLSDLQEGELIQSFESLLTGDHAADFSMADIFEEAVSDLGRIESINKIDSGWKALVEPWAEMRLRKRQKKDEASASLTQIVIDQSAGKLTFHIDNEQNDE